jgi:hypothetical protein
MTTHHSEGRKTLDLRRGVKLARAAYFSRKKCEPPPIVEAAFVDPHSEAVLRAYSADQIKEIAL